MAGIFEGVGEVVDKWLGIDAEWRGNSPRYGHEHTLQRLSNAMTKEGTGTSSCDNLIDTLVATCERSWVAADELQRGRPSKENWRSCKCPDCVSENRSLEVVLERLIVRLTSDDWWNQMPVDSGLLGSQGRSKVDLVHRQHDRYSLIELKIDANTPLFAAIEILRHGVGYLFTRDCLVRNKIWPTDAETLPSIMAARSIELIALAPQTYYERFAYSLSWLNNFEERLNAELQQSAVANRCGVKISFRFETFPEAFEWSLDRVDEAAAHESILVALNQRRSPFTR